MSEIAARRGVPGPLLGMIIFITSEIMFFGALFAAYFSLRAGASAWPAEGAEVERLVPMLITVILLSSSATVHLASKAAARGDARVTRQALALTVVLGLLFLGGQAFEYSRLNFTVEDGAFGSAFYALTGFHGLHVLIGVAALSLSFLQVRRAGLPARFVAQTEAAAYYWHFVDVVWVVLFTAIYLLQ